jgi:hypothetical protein
MTFKEAKAEMEKMLPNGVWHMSYEHWLFSCGPETKCKIYLQDPSGSIWENTWRECIDAVKKVLYPGPKMMQDDPDTEAATLPSNTHHEDALLPDGVGEFPIPEIPDIQESEEGGEVKPS